MKLSVIIPTHNRHDKLAMTLECLKHQDVAGYEYEIIVVDDGSSPRVLLPQNGPEPVCTLLRLEGVERSAARNRGSEVADSELLIFLDDDMTVNHDFISDHLRAHDEWPGALIVGSVRLTEEISATPFGRFRQKLEMWGVPVSRGLVSISNFCTASNMSISKRRFRELGGYDESIVSGEDQDLALRHTSNGGRIAFVPEALAVHHDKASDLKSYCLRAESGSEQMIAFCKRHPDWNENIEREGVNGPLRWGREPFLRSARKLVKSALTVRPIVALLFGAAFVLERGSPRSRVLDRVYRLLLGIHILRGYRNGVKRYGLEAGLDERRKEATNIEPNAISQPSPMRSVQE